MLDPSETIYTIYAYDESGQQYNIKEFATDLGWEENPGELAARFSFTVKDKTDDKNLPRISKKIKPGCLIVITAKSGTSKEQVARGYITTWNPVSSSKQEIFKVIGYDELFNMQKSQGQVYHSSGMTTKSVLKKLFSEWGIPLGKYEGPNEKHGKLLYDSENIAEIVYDVLDDAYKKGAKKAFIRNVKGKVQILKWGSNKDVWCFNSSNAVEANYKISTDDMITRVLILGKSSNKKRSPIEAKVDGKVKFGIRQKVHKRSKDESAAEAKKAANQILKDEGDPEKDIRVIAVDVPFVRKGDKVYMDKVGRLNGDYFVRGIRHDASKKVMTMDLSTKEGEK